MPGSNRVVVLAPGKLNLTLDITGTTGEGYHTLETVMQAIDLSDVVIVAKGRGRVGITCSNPSVPRDEGNIVHRAVTAFFDAAGVKPQGVSVHIDKRLPMQAGLAGGSADAAAALVALDHLFDTGMGAARLSQIGLGCGADVPFCIHGGCCLARGVGELLTPLASMPDCVIAVAKPAAGMSTRLAFARYDALAAAVRRPDTEAMLHALKQGALPGVSRHLHNVFEAACASDEVAAIKEAMLRHGALGAAMSGSGTAVFGLFSHEGRAAECRRHLEEMVGEAHLARPIATGPTILYAD